ncbi:MAG: outer membrane protein W [Candidatus Azotimanducaceae bacterium]|jgi:outer membrane protein W
MKKIVLTVIGLVLLQQSTIAMAHEQGNWIVRAGFASVQPDASSDSIDIAGIVTLPEADVGDETQIGITGFTCFATIGD